MGVGAVVLNLVGFVLALAFTWPSDFVLGVAPDPEVNAADIVTGTVSSAPLVPFVVLVVGTLLVRRRRWPGTVGAVLLTLVGVAFTVGGIGEMTSRSEMVPRAVLVVAGIVFALVGITLLLSGILELRSRLRYRGAASCG